MDLLVGKLRSIAVRGALWWPSHCRQQVGAIEEIAGVFPLCYLPSGHSLKHYKCSGKWC